MKYEKPQPDESGWTDWIQPVMDGYKLRCCDCDLVHRMDFRVEGDRVQFRVLRDNRATAASRRKPAPK